MFFSIAINNLFVLLIYASAGLIILRLTGSKFAPLAPWAVFSVHIVQISIAFFSHVSCLGLFPCLALVLPHAWAELSGFCLGCYAGSKLCYGNRLQGQLLAAAALIVAAAFLEAHITPFPLGQWLN